MTVHPTNRAPGSAFLSPTSSTSMTAATAIHEQYKEQLAKAGSEAPACQQPMPDEAFDSQASLSGVKLGPLLGQGSYGRVYRAQWQGAVCAVKVKAVDVCSVPCPTHAGALAALQPRACPSCPLAVCGLCCGGKPLEI